jgi:hypothetical protein
MIAIPPVSRSGVRIPTRITCIRTVWVDTIKNDILKMRKGLDYLHSEQRSVPGSLISSEYPERRREFIS